MKLGHNAKPKPVPPNIRVDLCGKAYGKWTVIGFWKRENGQTYWLCRCECGTKCAVQGGSLRSGGSKQCETCKPQSARTHGMSESPGYRVWKTSRDKLCDAWRNDGELFMAECYAHRDNHQTLMAIDESQPIGPGNFDWVFVNDLGLEIDGEWKPQRQLPRQAL